MTIYKEFNVGGSSRSPFGSFGPLIGLIISMVVLYFLVKGLFSILTILAPFLLIGAAILDYSVITDFIKFLLKLLKDNPLMGLVAIFLTVIGFPAVSGFLFFKAWARRTINKKLGDIKKERERFDEYEEVKTKDNMTQTEEEDFLNLPEMEVRKPADKRTDYDDLFK